MLLHGLLWGVEESDYCWPVWQEICGVQDKGQSTESCIQRQSWRREAKVGVLSTTRYQISIPQIFLSTTSLGCRLSKPCRSIPPLSTTFVTCSQSMAMCIHSQFSMCSQWMRPERQFLWLTRFIISGILYGRWQTQPLRRITRKLLNFEISRTRCSRSLTGTIVYMHGSKSWYYTCWSQCTTRGWSVLFSKAIRSPSSSWSPSCTRKTYE